MLASTFSPSTFTAPSRPGPGHTAAEKGLEPPQTPIFFEYGTRRVGVSNWKYWGNAVCPTSDATGAIQFEGGTFAACPTFYWADVAIAVGLEQWKTGGGSGPPPSRTKERVAP